MNAPGNKVEPRPVESLADERYRRISEELRGETEKLDADPPAECQTRIIARVQTFRKELEGIRL